MFSDLADPPSTDATAAEPTSSVAARRSVRLQGRSWWLALFAGALTTSVQWALQPTVNAPIAWLLPYPAVVLIALRQGLGPGLLTAVLCGLGATLVASPAGFSTTELPVQWGLFGTTTIIIALACSQSPRQRRRVRTASPAGTAPRIDTALTRWLEAVIWGSVLIPATLFASACWWGHAEAISTGRERVVRTNDVTLQHAERSFATTIDVVRKARSLAMQPDAEILASRVEVRQRLQDMMLGMTAVQAITIWNAEGRVVVSSMPNSTPNARTSIADRPYFDRARLGGDDVFFTDPVKGRISGITVINAVARRATADGSFAGIVVVALYPGFFQDFYQSLSNEQSGVGTFALFTAQGALLARWPPAEDEVRLPPDSKLAQTVLTGQASGLIRLRSKYDGRPRMISFRRLPGLPLYASVALDEGVIFAPWYRYVTLLAAVMGPLAIGLVYVSWLALKKTRREQVVLFELQAEMRRRGQTEKALAQAQRLEALSVLTGGVAHDFNNLLAIVNGNIHMIRRHHPEVGDGRHLIAISRAVASGVRLTRQLLSFARRQALKPEQIVLQTWLPGMSDLLKSTVGPGIDLQIAAISPEVPPIHVDAGELELALINLATNAKDAMDGRGILRLDVVGSTLSSTGSSRVILRVSDTGDGIPSALLVKVFEPFFTTKPPSKGTGLGLSQVHGFCLQAGGDASVQSTPGQGTTVVLSFPADAPAVPPTDDRGAPRQAVRLAGRVLLVEDNPDVAAAHRELLESAGATVDLAADGEAALRLLGDGETLYDLLLSDIAMPGGLDGIQLTVRLKATRPDLPVLLLTGYAARLEDAQRLGCRVLGKPVDPDLLIAEVGKAFRVEAVAG